MTTRIGINGFGRVGRQSLKAILERHPRELEVIAINDLTDPRTNAHLLKYDSTYGHFPGEISATEDALFVDGHPIQVLAQRDPAWAKPWRNPGVPLSLSLVEQKYQTNWRCWIAWLRRLIFCLSGEAWPIPS